MRLAQLPLIDLYIGEDFSEYRDQPGDDAPRKVLPDECLDQIEEIRRDCTRLYSEHRQTEFAYPHEKSLYRVTAIPDVTYQPIFILSRATDIVPTVSALGLPQAIVTTLRDKDSRGMILVAGDQGAGKTTTMAGMLVDRVAHLGGFGLALQDPIENNLRGLHGKGRIIQQPVDGVTGYAKAAQTAVRARMRTLSFGEIRRDPEGLNASTAIDLANAGNFILATIHATTLADAIARLIELATPNMKEQTAAAVAKALLAIVWQRLEKAGNQVRPVISVLNLNDPKDSTAIRTLIREMEYHKLLTYTQQQATRNLWGGGKAG